VVSAQNREAQYQMKIQLTERAQTDLLSLDDDQRAPLLDVLLQIPRAFRNLHEHTGLSPRKIHASGVWEVRAGLHLRVAFKLQGDAAVILLLGSHDEIQRFLRRL
jgi:mRNA-degrading endonuclease RelE of RelBE toxin-antitoxin system